MSGKQGAPLPGQPRVVTFGCRLNTFESEVMREHATKAGWGDAIIVNTCAVTGEAERQARQAIRKLRRENPNARIVVTGCAVQIAPERFGAMAEIDLVLGNGEKMDAASYRLPDGGGGGGAPRVQVGETGALKETARHLIGGIEGRARAFVEIQQGCDHRCTFCIIPAGRGPNRSADPALILAQIQALVAAGHGEVVLTGVDICSYGQDGAGLPGLGRLVRTILAEVPDLPRLRLTSLDPAAIDRDLEAAIAEEERLMPHFHLSVQAGDSMVLKRMARRHSRDDVLRLSERLRDLRPGAALGADLIAGFPTETDAMAERSAALIGEAGFSHLHIFPYSPRPGTPAARMPQVERATVKARARHLRALGDAAMESCLARQIGTRATVLVEKDGFGHSQHYLPTRLDAPAGTIVTTRIAAVELGQLIGEGPS